MTDTARTLTLAEPVAPASRISFHDHREILEANLARQIEAIRASDTKITLLVPTATAMLGILAALLRENELGQLSMLYVLLSTLPLLVAYGLMAMSVIPRLRGRSQPSLMFFGDLAARDHAGARDALVGLTPEAYLADLAGQCHVTAGIARTKTAHVRRAYLAFFLALPFWVLSIYLLNGA